MAKAKQRYSGKKGVANIARDINMLRGLINTEEKQLVSGWVAQTVQSTAASINVLAAPAEGSDSNQRTGRSIKYNRITMFLNFTWNAGTSGNLATQTFRWFILRWNNSPSTGVTTPSITDFLVQDPNAQFTPLSLPNPDTATDFAVIGTGLVTLTQPAQNQVVDRFVEFDAPLGFHQTFNTTAASGACTNMLSICVVSMHAFGAGGQSNYTGNIRTYYIDN